MMPTQRGVVMPFMILAAATVGWLMLGWWEIQQGALAHVLLPTGVILPVVRLFNDQFPGRAVPIPLGYWIGWLVYALIVQRVAGGTWRGWLARSFWSGLTAQGLLLVADLDRIMWVEAVRFLEWGYFAYYLGALGLLLITLGAVAGRASWRSWLGAGSASRLPGACAALFLVGYLTWHQHWWVLVAAGAGFGLGRSQAWWARGRRLWSRLAGWLNTPRAFMMLLWGAAVLTRLIYAMRLLSATGDRFPVAGDDSDTNDAFAWHLAQRPQDILLIDHAVVYPPGYWMFMAVFYRLFGHAYWPVVLAQVLISAIVPVCAYWLTRRLVPTPSGESAARVAGLLTMVNTALIHVSITFDQEAVFIPLLLLGLCALLRAVQPGRTEVSARWVGIAGLLFGWANFMRPVMIFFPAMLFFWFWAIRRRSRPAVRDLLWFTVPMLLVLAPLLIRNTMAVGHLTVTSEAYIHYNKTSNEGLISLGIDPFQDFGGSVAALLRHPVEAFRALAAVAPIRFVQFFFLPFFGTFDPIQILNPGAFATGYALHMEFYAYLAVAIGGWWLLRQTASREGMWLFLWVIAYFCLTPLVFFVRNATYRVPLHPVFFVWLAVGAVAAWDWCRRVGARRA